MDQPQAAEPLKNRVASSKSPYVSAQATSPVAWQLLDDEAISRAKAENKMVFLNIVCRLMMAETFAHPRCAEMLNSYFIPVIVDREEHPDVDTIYMNYVQAVNGAGGWPLNLFLTPELAPVFGGTYWPGPSPSADPSSSIETTEGEELDFLLILKKLRKVWLEQETRCRTEAKDVLAQLREFAAEGTLGRTFDHRGSFPAILAPPSAALDMHVEAAIATSLQPDDATELDLDQLEEAYRHIAGTFDPIYGGFGIAPKFPTPAKLSFLLRLSELLPEVQDVVGSTQCAHAREMALFTLRKIRDGALRDHVGGQGLARYSVTSDWSIPHFEKLVVDNALLLSVYLDAWISSGSSRQDEFYDIVIELADYLSSAPIRLPEGGFASSEAADTYYRHGDTHLRDGAYQLWTKREFDSVIGNSEESAVAAAHWGVLEHGNVEPDQDPHDEFMNRNVLRIVKDVPDLAKQFKLSVAEVKAIIQNAKAKLKAQREKERVRPSIDDKVIASWNGLVISSLSRAASSLQYVDGDIPWRQGNTKGLAEDYAYLIEGLLDLYLATLEEEWLRWADELQKIQLVLFYDAPKVDENATTLNPSSQVPCGAFYSTEADSPQAILRLKDGMDTSLLHQRHQRLQPESVSAFEAEILQYPWLFLGLLTGIVNLRLGGPNFVVVRQNQGAAELASDSISFDTFFKAIYNSPSGGLKAISVISGKDSWVLNQNPALKELAEGKDGIYCLENGKFRAFNSKDLGSFTRQS
ncbi:unnamed protein product [Parascedosporium putredinis]|uniref:Spermatogenesis-associated protein 20-like TRX domain-containing protein n=1 Tax=Parascedosporium putredinis TaxID=1442378 RepID=A0A9P1M5P0_9PEZI|nr:unnamed protein product [Parascedosporium putredinis]CAI7988269.1 unnamed protein product [Parascedosporium putredinis]